MNKNQKVFFIYSIFTTIIWLGLILLASFTVNTNYTLSDLIITGEKVSFMLAYGILALLIYRTIIVYLKVKVEKLAKWHSKREEVEDYEFVRLVELLIGVISILSSSFIGAIVIFLRQDIGVFYVGYKDLLIIFLGAFFASSIAFYLPILLEKEYMLIAGNKKKVTTSTAKNS